MNQKLKHLASLIVVAIFIAIAYGSEDEKTTEKAIAAEKPAFSVSSKKLYADYDANGVAADEKYKDKVIRVTGKVTTIDRDIMDKIYVTLKGDEYFGDVQCFFAEDHTKTASKLSKGQRITVKGKCEGKMMNVLLKGCIIE